MPSPLLVDLATTIVPSDHKIWKLFPGESYKFATLIAEKEVAFVDVRGLNELGGNPKDWKRDDLLELISIDRWERQNAQKAQKSERRISSGDKQTATFIDGLFNIAKKGDFVVVPGKGAAGVASVYELTGKKKKATKFEGQDGRFTGVYLGRRMKWIGSVPNRRLPVPVLERLQTPMAFFDMGDAGRELFYEEVLGNYVYNSDHVATYRVAKTDYNSRDNRYASTWMEFVDLVSNGDARAQAIQLAEDDSIYELLEAVQLSEANRSDLSININSPGEILMRAVAHTPLIGLALFPLATQGVSYDKAKMAQVQATALGGATDDCSAEVEAEVRAIIEALGQAKWEKACKLAQRAKNEAEISTDSVIE